MCIRTMGYTILKGAMSPCLPQAATWITYTSKKYYRPFLFMGLNQINIDIYSHLIYVVKTKIFVKKSQRNHSHLDNGASASHLNIQMLFRSIFCLISSVLCGDTMGAVETGQHCGGCSVLRRNTISAAEDVQYCGISSFLLGVHYQYCGKRPQVLQVLAPQY